MIRLEHVNKTYQTGVPALKDVSLHINPGEFVFIVGDSGSGKSTLIKLLLAELKPTKGKVIINGKDLSNVKRKNIPKFRRNIGVVFQDFRLLLDRNVYENVAFAMKVVEASNKDIKKKVPQMLSVVGLASKYKSLPKQLSGGEQQRVAIARAILNGPEVIIADEPTGNLDGETAEGILSLLSAINKEKGTAIVMVTHNRSIIERYPGRVFETKDETCSQI